MRGDIVLEDICASFVGLEDVVRVAIVLDDVRALDLFHNLPMKSEQKIYCYN